MISAGLSSQLVRSLTKRPKLDLRQSIKGIRTRNHAKGVLRARGFFVHYLALTFSTLLSSQVSGAHRTGLFGSGLGQRPTLRGLASPSQTRTFWFVQDHQSPDLMRLWRAHIYPNISLASGFLPGRPLQIDKSDASRAPAEAPHTLRLRDPPVKPDLIAVHAQAPVRRTHGGSWVFRVMKPHPLAARQEQPEAIASPNPLVPPVRRTFIWRQ
jgi:hypothetical protein